MLSQSMAEKNERHTVYQANGRPEPTIFSPFLRFHFRNSHPSMSWELPDKSTHVRDLLYMYLDAKDNMVLLYDLVF